MQPKTLYDKIWDAHLVHEAPDGTCLLYIDRHLVHEVTSPQAFEGLRMAGRKVRAPEKTVAVPDHNVPTDVDRARGIENAESRIQVDTLRRERPGVRHRALRRRRRPPGHRPHHRPGAGADPARHDHRLRRQPHRDARRLRGAGARHRHVGGRARARHPDADPAQGEEHEGGGDRAASPLGVTAKDITLSIIGETGTAGGNGHVIEYCGEAIRALSMEGRMTVCNMAIEGGARAGLIAPDDKTYAYVKGRPHAPKAGAWEMAEAHWRTLFTDEGARFDREVVLDAGRIAPVVTWGTSPEDVLPITGVVPHPEDFKGGKVDAARRSLEYMGLTPGTRLQDIEIDTVFIGSCTNGRIEDLREVAKVMEGRRVKDGLRAMIVPGSGLVRAQAEEEGIAQKLIEAGFDWRMAGCSMCLGMNPDQLAPGERCASTSNRNFEGRQGYKGRTHLLSPAMAAAAAITGRLTDVRELM